MRNAQKLKKVVHATYDFSLNFFKFLKRHTIYQCFIYLVDNLGQTKKSLAHWNRYTLQEKMSYNFFSGNSDKEVKFSQPIDNRQFLSEI